MNSIEIANSDNEKLRGVLHKAASDKLIIVCHGFKAAKDDGFIKELCEAIAIYGFNAFRFDFSGNGKSEGEFENSTITKEVDEIKSVSDYFTGNGLKIHALIGHSMGAVAVLLHQAKFNTAKKVIDIAGTLDQKIQLNFSRLKELQENGYFIEFYKGKYFKITMKYYSDRLSYGNICPRIGTISVPVLVVHGTNDKDTPVDQSREIIKCLPKGSKLVLIERADHFFKDNADELIETIISWLNSKR